MFTAELDVSDGIDRVRRSLPLLVRYSGRGAFPVGWESVANLRPTTGGGTRPQPAAREEAALAALTALEQEVERQRQTQARWVTKAKDGLAEAEARWRRQIRDLDADARRAAMQRFQADKARRLADLADVERVEVSRPELVGWVAVQGGARAEELGYDPDSERVAVRVVLEELEREGFVVDDRQTAGVGYDLFAHHPRTREQRLVEVKGQLAGLSAVTMESHEWGQAMQRADEYWLYVVTHCATSPVIAVRLSDPAGQLGGPRLIERFQIPVSKLRPHDESGR